MFERANLQREYAAVAVIMPARSQIVDEHYVSFRSLLPLVTASAFVPPGREDAFALGLSAGFDGDFATALHVLMPQFEHAVRCLLADVGAMTSKVDEEGVQDERDLGWLLTCDHAKQAIDEALLFDIRGLLIERFGANLRNQMAHGLLDVDQMVGPSSIYFWWLTLYMVVHPILATYAESPEGDGAATEAEPETASEPKAAFEPPAGALT